MAGVWCTVIALRGCYTNYVADGCCLVRVRGLDVLAAPLENRAKIESARLQPNARIFDDAVIIKMHRLNLLQQRRLGFDLQILGTFRICCVCDERGLRVGNLVPGEMFDN